jgi:hypothetical protein
MNKKVGERMALKWLKVLHTSVRKELKSETVLEDGLGLLTFLYNVTFHLFRNFKFG